MLCHCRTGHMRKLDRASRPEHLPGGAVDWDDLSGKSWHAPACPAKMCQLPSWRFTAHRANEALHVDGTDHHVRDRRFSPRTRNKKIHRGEPCQFPLDDNGKQIKTERGNEKHSEGCPPQLSTDFSSPPTTSQGLNPDGPGSPPGRRIVQRCKGRPR